MKIGLEKNTLAYCSRTCLKKEKVFNSFCHQEFTAGGKLGDEGHAVLVVVDLDQAGEPRVVEDVHHFEFVHHPEKEILWILEFIVPVSLFLFCRKTFEIIL